MAKDLAIVLNSGSVSSAVATALTAQRYRPVMLHAVARAPAADSDEEQPSRARVAFEQQVGHFKPYREHVLPMTYLEQLASAAGPKQGVALPDARNTSVTPQMVELLPLMSAAIQFAAHYQAAAVYLGLRVGNQPDTLGQASEFIQIWTELAQLPCGLADLEIVAPLLELELWQVVDLAFQVNAPMDKTWSCATDAGEPCWACRGCRAREAAFQQAGKPDPLRVVKKV